MPSVSASITCYITLFQHDVVIPQTNEACVRSFPTADAVAFDACDGQHEVATKKHHKNSLANNKKKTNSEMNKTISLKASKSLTNAMGASR